MLSSASGTTLHKNFPVQCCPRRSYSWGNIAQIKTLCSVVFQAPDNNAQEKILFYVVLILLGQHYIGKNPMQCWTWGSRQQCTGKNLVQCCLNTLGTTWRRSKPSAMLSERLQTTLHRKNPVQNPVQSFLHIHGTTWYRKSLCNIVPEAPFHRQHCSIAPDNIAQEKIQAMFSEQHLVTPLINIHQVLHVRKKKRSYLSFTAKIG